MHQQSSNVNKYVHCAHDSMNLEELHMASIQFDERQTYKMRAKINSNSEILSKDVM